MDPAPGVVALGLLGLDLDALFTGALAEVAAADDDAPVPHLVTLCARPTREVFERAAALIHHDDPDHRELGAMVLRSLGPQDEDRRRPFTDEAVPLLRAAMRDEPDAWPLSAMVSALGYNGAPEALDDVLALADHPGQPVRLCVANNLPGLADPECTQERVLDALLRLTDDPSEPVRWYATYGLLGETAGVPRERRQRWIEGIGARGGERRAELQHVLDALAD